MGLVIAIVLGVTRSRDDADKGIGAYIVKTMIVVCPVIYLGLIVMNGNSSSGKATGGHFGGSSAAVLDMRTGIPDF